MIIIVGGGYTSGGRFDEIIKIVKDNCPNLKTSFDFGGNTGLFAKKCLDELGLERVICQDVDEEAVDLGYKNNRDDRLIFINFNTFSLLKNIDYESQDEKQFKSDIVFALALTHHLILSQSIQVDHIFEKFSSYSNEYACIEFMPKGLWVPGADVDIPHWYNVDWFRDNFGKYFNILTEKQLEENRIVFVGRKKYK